MYFERRLQNNLIKIRGSFLDLLPWGQITNSLGSILTICPKCLHHAVPHQPASVTFLARKVNRGSDHLVEIHLHKTCTQDPDVKLGNQEPRVEGVWHVKGLHELFHVYSLQWRNLRILGASHILSSKRLTWLQCVSRMYPHALSLALGICPANTLLNRLWTKFFGWWIWLLSSCFSTFFSSWSLDVPVWKEVERGSKAKLVCLSRAWQPLICLRGRLSVVSSTLLHTPAAETPRFLYKAMSFWHSEICRVSLSSRWEQVCMFPPKSKFSNWSFQLCLDGRLVGRVVCKAACFVTCRHRAGFRHMEREGVSSSLKRGYAMEISSRIRWI